MKRPRHNLGIHALATCPACGEQMGEFTEYRAQLALVLHVRAAHAQSRHDFWLEDAKEHVQPVETEKEQQSAKEKTAEQYVGDLFAGHYA